MSPEIIDAIKLVTACANALGAPEPDSEKETGKLLYEAIQKLQEEFGFTAEAFLDEFNNRLDQKVVAS